MKRTSLIAATLVATSPVMAEETRQLDAHEHGVGQLDIAFDGNQIMMELHAPGADIVGFEYQAESEEDRKAIDTAVSKLALPLNLLGLPAGAKCNVLEASAELESEDAHDDHDDHADDKHDDHKDDDHDDHADDNHDDHKDDDHDDHKDDKHDDHKDDDHADTQEAGHTEFHAEYKLTCTQPNEFTKISFTYFDVFPNARELEVQVITNKGASAFEVLREDPTLDLSGLF